MSGYREILEQVRDGALSVDDALLTIKKKPFADIGYAKVDLHRAGGDFRRGKKGGADCRHY